ncbi:hypothetical protein RRG08_027051 [Elysia crispata]|uniref:Uncharacterized protein n=1 Tax=Elysia crispata TaxID=231223 RepID=A0AAE0ZIP8_9GAST|nr:hypothetical protein RRG08_027051 [Elysia crispata]
MHCSSFPFPASLPYQSSLNSSIVSGPTIPIAHLRITARHFTVGREENQSPRWMVSPHKILGETEKSKTMIDRAALLESTMKDPSRRRRPQDQRDRVKPSTSPKFLDISCTETQTWFTGRR